VAVAQRAPQRSNVDAQISLVDEGIGPGTCDEIFLTNDLAASTDENNQNVKRARAQTHRRVVLQQQLSRWVKLERPEARDIGAA